MFSIETVVRFIVYILGVGIIFGLLHGLICYVETKFPTTEPFIKFAHIALAIFGVLILIGIILSAMGHPIIRFD